MDREYRDENVLVHARESFQDMVALNLQHLRRFIAKGTNPDLTGAYVECIVRNFVRTWLGNLRLCHGTFYSEAFEKSGEKPMQIDGIVWNPKAGPAILQEDDFIVVHPVFCTSVIEIKTSIPSLKDFEERLQTIYSRYMYCGTKPQIMGIVTADKDPEVLSHIVVGDRDNLRNEMDEALKAGVGPKVARFALAALGSIPLAGGAIAGTAGVWSEAEQDHFKRILRSWLKLQEDELKEIGQTLTEVMMRVDQTDEKIRERMESPEYLSLVKKCFRDWSAAESEEKRVLLRNLLCNAAAGEKICGDSIIRLFIEWIDRFSESHFSIVRMVYQHPGITRHEMWQDIHGQTVREDSAEADLFKLLVQDLSVGHMIRQHRETDYQGRFLKSHPQRGHGSSAYVKSAFDDDKQYELTELGRWFVHYTMNEMVPKLTAGQKQTEQSPGAGGGCP